LTQEAFAERYGTVATVRDWEQGRSSPDATAQSYLKLIRTDLKKVARMLEAS
jgi:putative transcriptional regulator